MKRMIAITIRPGATTAAVRRDRVRERLAHHPPAGGHEDEEERPEQLREEPAPLLTRVVEVLEGCVELLELPLDVTRHWIASSELRVCKMPLPPCPATARSLEYPTGA